MSGEPDAGDNRASMPAASSLPAYLRAETQYGTIICTEHRTAYTLQNVMNHLVNEHKMSKPVRDALQRRWEAEGVADTVTEPAHGCAPIQGLLVLAGWQCNINHCSVLSQSKSVVEKHCSKKHGLTSKRRRREMDAIVSVSLQHWFAKTNKYWRVHPGHTHPSSVPASSPPASHLSSPLPVCSSPPPHSGSNTTFLASTPRSHVFQTLSQQVHDEEAQTRRIYHATEHPSESSPWLRKCGYDQHLRGIDKDELRPLLKLPRHPGDNSPTPLFYLLESVDRILTDAYAHVDQLHPIHAMRLNSFEVGRQSNDPFKPLQNMVSFRKYRVNFQRMICYLYCAQEVAQFDDESPHPLYQTTPEQDAALQLLHSEIDELERGLDQFERHSQYAMEAGPEVQHGHQDLIRHLEDRVDRETLRFLVALLHHPTATPFQSVIMSYCAVASWSFGSQAFLGVGEATSVLSQTIYGCQLVLLAQAHDLVVQQEHPDAGSALTVLCREWCHNDAFGPLGDMVRLRVYGLSVGRQTVAVAPVRWRADHETLMYKDLTYRISDLVTEIDFCLRQARQIFQDDLCLHRANIPRFHLQELEDDWDNERAGGSFLTDPRNAGQLGPYEDWLSDQVADDADLYRVVVQHASESDTVGDQVRSGFAREYEASVQRFLGYLALLMHKGSGQPGRGTEFVGLRWRNLARGGVKRNLFVHDGYLLFLLTYHKTEYASHASRYPVRFLLPEVGQLLVQYLVLIMPFRAMLSKGVAVPSQVSEYLWHDGEHIWASPALSRIMNDTTREAHGIAVNLASWRQMAVAIAIKKFGGTQYEADLDMPTDATDDLGGRSIADSWGGAMADVFHHQAAHTVRTGNRAYGGTVNFQAGLTDAGLQEYLRASRLWHQLCRPRPVPSIVGHRRQASQSLIHPPLRQRLISRARPVRHAMRWGSEQIDFALRQLFPGVDDVRFQGAEQRELIEAIATGCPEVVGVLRTGQGKSLAFLLPACLPRAGTTVVILPLVALKADMVRRCQDVGLTYAVWERVGDSQRFLGTPLLFVSVEQAVSQKFMTFLGQLDATSALDRIVFDEAHLVLTAISYRRHLALHRRLRQYLCQVVFLTATLPPLMQAQFEARFLLHRPRVVRARSFRPEIVLRVRRAPDGNLLSYTHGVVQEMLQQYREQPAARLLVYTSTRLDADRLSQLLSCPKYYSDSGDAEEKAEAMQVWRSGTSRVMVATSAFGLGVDYPAVRQVVHVDAPRDMLEFAQEIGRLSRDGQVGHSHIILPRAWRSPGLPSVVDQRRSALPAMAMLTYLEDNRCLSAVLSRFLDGPEHVHYCMEPDPSRQCSRCTSAGLFRWGLEADPTAWWDARTGQGHDLESSDHADGDGDPARSSSASVTPPPDLGAGGERLRALVQQEAIHNERYREGLQLLRGRCMLCMVLDQGRTSPTEQMHSLTQCHRVARHLFFRAKREAIDRNRSTGGWMKPFIACFQCGQPQEICPVAADGIGECQYRDIIFPLTWALSRQERSWGRTLGDLTGLVSSVCQDEERYMDWLGRECQLYGMRASQGARVTAKVLQLELAEVFQ